MEPKGIGIDQVDKLPKKGSFTSEVLQGSCVITSKPTGSLSSPASRCNGYCITQMQPEGLWDGPWSCQALV